MTSKERAVQIISRLPEDASVVDIMEELYVQMKVEEGLRQLDGGAAIAHKEVVARVRKWTE
jgi:hypothetical protein